MNKNISVSKIFLVLMSTFVPNSININAGINGYEVGQSLIVLAAVSLTNSPDLSIAAYNVLLALAIL